MYKILVNLIFLQCMLAAKTFSVPQTNQERKVRPVRETLTTSASTGTKVP